MDRFPGDRSDLRRDRGQDQAQRLSSTDLRVRGCRAGDRRCRPRSEPEERRRCAILLRLHQCAQPVSRLGFLELHGGAFRFRTGEAPLSCDRGGRHGGRPRRTAVHRSDRAVHRKRRRAFRGRGALWRGSDDAGDSDSPLETSAGVPNGKGAKITGNHAIARSAGILLPASRWSCVRPICLGSPPT